MPTTLSPAAHDAAGRVSGTPSPLTSVPVPELVWAALTDPDKTAAYLHGLAAHSTWIPGAPIGFRLGDPLERFAAVRAQMSALNASKEATVGEAMVSLGRYTAFPLASMFVRLAFSLPGLCSDSRGVAALEVWR